MSALFRAATLAAGVAVGLDFTAHLVSAQSVFERAKRAAEEAARKAREGQKPPPPAPQTPQASQPSNPPNRPAAAPSEAAGGDCCSADALKKIASSSGFVDIVGIKLGMTPEQAFAAVKAFNPQLKIDIVNSRMEYPDGPLGNFTPVPQYAVAHTVGKQPVPNPAAFTLPDYSSDVIVMEFTLPPSPPLVGKIVRQVTFPQAQPVVATNLIEALRKKYGQEKSTEGTSLVWVFDAAGKPVSRPLQRAEAACASGHPFGGFGWTGGGGMPTGSDMGRDSPIQLNVALLEREDPERSPVCRPFTIVMGYPLGEATPPNQQMVNMTVMIQSPALLYGSQKASHDWLKAKGDAKTRQLEDAAKSRTAPKL